MKTYTLVLTAIAVVSLAAIGPAQTRDRRLVGIRTSRAPSNTGNLNIHARVRILSNDPAMANLGFTVTTFRGAGTGGPQIDSRTYAASPSANSLCGSQPVVNCAPGICSPIIIDGVQYPGVCSVEETVVTGGNPFYECICRYGDAEVDAADEVNVLPGQQITVQISPAGGLNDSTFFPPNDTLTVTIGSRADEPGFGFSGRLPSPMCGQGNSSAASLVQSDALGTVTQQGEGPFEFWAAPGTQMMSMHSGGGSNNPITLLWSQTPDTGSIEVANLSIDIDPGSLWGAFYDGVGIGAPCGGFPNCNPPPQARTTGPTGTFVANWTVPNIPDGHLLSLQGLNVDPASPLGFVATARNDLGVQTLPTSPPALPPYPGGGVVPPLAATAPFACLPGTASSGSPVYPWPRDAIVPNHGPTQTGAGVGDGTLHSMIGSGFDATAASATSVSVNAINVDVWVVRPQEILFRLVPAHEPLIGGPVVVTSTGGVSATVADQMENWVFATPPATLFRSENFTGGSPPVVGFFDPDGGLQGARGSLPPGAQRNWRMDNLPMGTPVRAFVGQLSPCTRQLVVRCVPAAVPVTGATCYLPTAQPFTQMPGPPSPVEDLRLFHVFGTTSFSTLAIQEDGGPGSSPFAGMTHIPASPTGAATVPADPDIPFSMMGMNDALTVAGAGVSPAAGPYQYMILVSW